MTESTSLTQTPPAPIFVAVPMMDQAEARRTVEQIREHLDGARRLLVDLDEREGWRALGYASWRECAAAEFGQSQAHVYRLLTAGKIERAIDSPIGEIPESHLRPLAALDTAADQRAALDRATEIAGDGPRTAKHVQQAVDEIKPAARPQNDQPYSVEQAFPLRLRKRAEALGAQISSSFDITRQLAAVWLPGATASRWISADELTTWCDSQPITPESRDADGPWFKASISAAHPTAHHWNVKPSEHSGRYVSACGITSPTLPTTGADAGLCSVCAKHGDRRELVPIPSPVEQTPAAQPADQAIKTTIREKAASLGLELAWEGDGVMLYWPDEVDDLEQMDVLPYEVALEWLEGDAIGIAASRAERAAPAAPACENCGRPATSKKQIGGVLMHRCDTCAAQARYDAAQAEQTASAPATALAALCERAEELGAQINYLATSDPAIMRVTPPPGYQQHPLDCDEADLARLVAAWDKQPAARPAPHAIDWNIVAKHTYALGATGDARTAWELWAAIGQALAQDDPRSFAIRLLKTLAPLIGAHPTEDAEALASAIGELNECQEGTEAAQWVAVGWALLDIEAAS